MCVVVLYFYVGELKDLVKGSHISGYTGIPRQTADVVYLHGLGIDNRFEDRIEPMFARHR